MERDASQSCRPGFFMKLSDIMGKQQTLRFYVICSTAQKPPESHVLFDNSKETFHLDAAVHPKSTALFAGNPLKAFCWNGKYHMKLNHYQLKPVGSTCC